MEGWIKLYRSSLEHWLYIEKRPLTRREAWEDMIMLCNHDDDKVLIHGSLIDCKRGQSVQSLQTWSDHFRWSVKKTRIFFSLLEKDQMIVTEGLQKTTRLTICNYGKYQDNGADKGQTEGEQRADRGQTEGKQRATNKNGKNIKNEKNGKNIEGFLFVLPEFLSTWEKWIGYRAQIKKPYRTENGMIKKYNELIALSGNDPTKALAIVQQSIDEEWTGFFPLKTNGKAFKSLVPGEDIFDKQRRELKEIRLKTLQNGN